MAAINQGRFIFKEIQHLDFTVLVSTLSRIAHIIQFMGMQYCSKKVSLSDKALLVFLVATSLLIKY